MNLIIDENLPPIWCEFLYCHSHTAIHWQDIGQHGDPDEMIFDYAQAERSIILTQDLDFGRILALRGTQLPSLIQLRVDCPIPSEIGTTVIQVLQIHAEALMAGVLISIEPERHRVRLLPLQ